MVADKCCLAGFLIMLSCSLAMAAAPAVHPTTGEPLVINCLRGTPSAIDGDLNDWNLEAMTPAILDVAGQLNSGQASWDSPEDLSGQFYLLWDDENIYIAVVVKDDVLSNNKTGANIWNADCVEVFFATTNAVAGHDEHYQYGFDFNGQKWNWCNMDGTGDREPDYLEVASTITADGYICEAAIEYGQMLSLDFTVGNAIGFHPVFDDTDATDREIQMTWTSREAHDQTLGYGHLILSADAAISPELAHSPSPGHEIAGVPVDVSLSWSPGDYAVSHTVYFGTVFDDVNNATRDNPLGLLVAQEQQATTYDPPGRLQYGQTYYWRVDEVNAPPDSTVHKGGVWSFTTEPLLYPIENVTATASIPTGEGAGGPEAIVDGSGLADGKHSTEDPTMWLGDGSAGGPAWVQFDFDRLYKICGIHVWNFNAMFEGFLGFGFKDVTIEYATEPDVWFPLGDFQLQQATSKPTYAGQVVDLNPVAARSIRIHVNSNFSGRTSYGLSEIQFLHKPVFAREPEPADGTTDVDRNATLTWRPGREAVTHQVQLGTDAAAVAQDGALAGTATTSTFDPGPLTLGTTYYWKVNEVNEAETPALWDSTLWSFTVQENVSIDGFEGYTDVEGSLIYEAWLDGFGITENGSQVGHDAPPYAEKSIRNSGVQAMPFYYNNISGVTYSETERALSPAQDWTANGADTFSLYYRGEPTGFAQVTSDEIVMNGTGDDIWGTTDQFRFVYKPLTGNGSIIARVEYVDNTDEWVKAGVMIRETLESDSVLVDGIVTANGRVGMQWRSGRAVDMASPDATNHSATGTVTFPVWVKLTRNGNVFKVQHSQDGVTWVDIVPETADRPLEITQTMPQTVYIGLAVCSHNVNAVAGAHFTGIATTGNVTGQWQSMSIGMDQPAGNGLDRFYLAVEDSSGRKATFANPSAAAVALGSWQQWSIPVSDIAAAGVNTSSVAKIYLGVGDRTQPSKNASGVLYIDDVAFGNPAE